MPVELSDVCNYCGRELWEHVQRKSSLGLDIMPCVEHLRELLEDDWSEKADANDNCKLCGKPYQNHFEYERMTVEAMGVVVVDRSETTYLFPTYHVECGMVPIGEPICNDINLPKAD